jgi:hypothetical protein
MVHLYAALDISRATFYRQRKRERMTNKKCGYGKIVGLLIHIHLILDWRFRDETRPKKALAIPFPRLLQFCERRFERAVAIRAKIGHRLLRCDVWSNADAHKVTAIGV